MTRPKKSDAPDLTRRMALSTGAIERLRCPPDKAQAFLRDSEVPALRVRITAAGSRSFIFETKLHGKTLRRTIGDVRDWSIEQARAEARRMGVIVDGGQDPRDLQREQHAARQKKLEAERAEAERSTITGLAAWQEYLQEGAEVGFSQRGPWGARHLADHLEMSDPGGKPFKRGKGTTAAGPLYPLLSLPLADINEPALAAWLKAENTERASRVALAFRLVRAFLNWCEEHPRYRDIVKPQAHQAKEVRRLVRKPTAKADALQREQLAAWFTAVGRDASQVVATYLVTLLLTGARKSEIAHVRWEDVDLRFGGSLTVRDKVEGVRVIPCPDYVAKLLTELPRRGPWVFGSDAAPPKIAHNATYNHRRALVAAGLPHVTLHGLRRSFGSLAEWVECPAGVVAQLQGHRPSATAEKHYRVRPLDLLRVWHNRIERWILDQAGIQFERLQQPGHLHLVAGSSSA